MREWIAAMLVIGFLMVLRDMAKIVVSIRKIEKEEAIAAEENPQKERVLQYASAFYRLSDMYQGMPHHRDYLSKQQLRHVLEETCQDVCTYCYQKNLCWGEQAEGTYRHAASLLRVMEREEKEKQKELRTDWMAQCARSIQFLDCAGEYLGREQQSLMLNNQMIEGRLAVARQMQEIGEMMETVAGDLYDITPADQAMEEEIRRKMKQQGLLVRTVWMLKKTEEGRKQIFLNMKAKNRRCVSLLEAARLLSEICETPMISARDGRCTVNGAYHTFQFLEDSSYKLLYGVAKLTKEGEEMSGDSFICRELDQGKYVICLSDGMGSGKEAGKESERVVELLEQFLESGFTQETAARMVNSALVLRQQDGSFSTMDISLIDLYSGMCRILKAGAATTYIRRDHWVEAISSTSMALGMLEEIEFDNTARKLYHGDILILMTDGVLDALPEGKAEETMKEIILEIEEENLTVLSREIMERVLGYCDYHPRDDMTILAAGFWRK